MRYFLTAVLSVTVLLVATTSSRAETTFDGLSAADLSAMCTGTTGDSKTCQAYVAGFSQGFYYASAGARAGYAACVPRGITNAQAQLIMTEFMSKHPEMMQQGAPSVVAEALVDAFPCGASR